MSLPPGITRADFFAGRYRLSADVATGDRRLVEVMRDPTRQYLDVRRLYVTAIDGSEPEAQYADGLLSKADIEWVAIRAEPPRGEARLYGYVKKAPVPVGLVLRTVRIEGTVHVESGSTDPASFFLRGLEKGTERFIAVTSAAITPTQNGDDAPHGLAIVNRSAVRLFSVLRD